MFFATFPKAAEIIAITKKEMDHSFPMKSFKDLQDF